MHKNKAFATETRRRGGGLARTTTDAAAARAASQSKGSRGRPEAAEETRNGLPPTTMPKSDRR